VPFCEVFRRSEIAQIDCDLLLGDDDVVSDALRAQRNHDVLTNDGTGASTQNERLFDIPRKTARPFLCHSPYATEFETQDGEDNEPFSETKSSCRNCA